ncbi:MAG: hypothetical protein M1829_006675 [Trizodia sp. TS-e1964]|nr:MAG: hypothetical protein M1829_006675 [Trizodia sp. TS-e1964]
MAPSGMFSYLRSHHKRSHSPPSSRPARHSSTSPPLQSPGSVVSPVSLSDRESTKSHSPVSPLPQPPCSLPTVDGQSSLDGGAGSTPSPPAQGEKNENLEQQRSRSQILSNSSKSSQITGSFQNTPSTMAASYATQTPLKTPPKTPSSHSKFGRSKLNLLNPMSLLARRRTSPSPNLLSHSTLDKGIIMPSLDFPDDYDPRIRGKGVHDFSAPRTRRTAPHIDLTAISNGKTESFSNPKQLLGDGIDPSSGRGYESTVGGRSGERERTPVFKEHFGDEVLSESELRQKLREDRIEILYAEAKSKELLAPSFQTSSLQTNKPLHLSTQISRTPPIPAKDPPPPQSKPRLPERPGALPIVKTDLLNDLRNKELPDIPDEEVIDTTFLDSPARRSLSAKSHRSRGVSFSDTTTSGLPKRYKSNASRFSFDLGGVGSAAQEKLLEEKHKQKAEEKRLANAQRNSIATSADMAQSCDGADNDLDDFDDYGDDGAFEERIPGVNADLDEIEDDVNTEAENFEEQPSGGNTDLEEPKDIVTDDHHNADGEETPSVTAAANGSTEEALYSNFEDFVFQSTTKSPLLGPKFPPGLYSPVPQTPRDEEGHVIGFAFTKEPTSPYIGTASQSFAPLPASSPPIGLVNESSQNLQFEPSSSPPKSHLQPDDGEISFDDCHSMHSPPAVASDDDDLYFDDGIIDHPEGESTHEFDESVFDDETNPVFGRPLRELKPPRYLDDTTDSSPAKYTSGEDEDDSIGPQDSQETDTEFPPMLNPVSNGPIHQAALSQQRVLGYKYSSIESNKLSPPSSSAGLTQDNLLANHNALVAAANAAVESGRFVRSEDSGLDDEDVGNESNSENKSYPSLMPDDGRPSEETSGYDAISRSGLRISTDLDYDAEFDDDKWMVEAANAEALANDSEGFYGQEFDFYSAPYRGEGDAEYVNGGYFGPRGGDGLVRSQSGRGTFREPNLTPITERSEYSNRNSFINLSLHGSGTLQQLTNANLGLAQLAMTEVDEDDLTLGSLMKLRRGAWGSSNVSLKSAENSSPVVGGGSPLSQRPPFGFGSSPGSSGNFISPTPSSSIPIVVSSSVSKTSPAPEQHIGSNNSSPRSERVSSISESVSSADPSPPSSPTITVSKNADASLWRPISLNTNSPSIPTVPNPEPVDQIRAYSTGDVVCLVK